MLVARGGRDVVRGVCEVTDDGRGGAWVRVCCPVVFW